MPALTPQDREAMRTISAVITLVGFIAFCIGVYALGWLFGGWLGGVAALGIVGGLALLAAGFLGNP